MGQFLNFIRRKNKTNINKTNNSIQYEYLLEQLNKSQQDIEYLKNRIDNELSKTITDKDHEIYDLNKQIIALVQINNNLNNIKIKPIEQRELMTIDNLSKKRITDIVDDLLKDKNININYFPDWVEKKLYYNVLTILINVLEHVIDTSKIDFLGHQITFDLSPIPA